MRGVRVSLWRCGTGPSWGRTHLPCQTAPAAPWVVFKADPQRGPGGAQPAVTLCAAPAACPSDGAMPAPGHCLGHASRSQALHNIVAASREQPAKPRGGATAALLSSYKRSEVFAKPGSITEKKKKPALFRINSLCFCW